MKCEAVFHQGSTNATSAPSGIDKQRFHVSSIDQHEGQRVVILINRQPEWSVREEITHHFVYGLAILRREKVMSGVNSAAPDFDNAGALVRT